MLMCKGKCDRPNNQENIIKNNIKHPTLYLEDNKKFCSICNKFIKEVGLRCFCCSAKFRIMPKTTEFRKALQKRLGINTEGY
jgi:hypothetical protein